MKLTPIAIFSYNRPNHARNLFESLRNCHRLDECLVLIFCDGQKKAEHSPGIHAMRQLAHEYAPLLNNATVIERKQNLGLARSVVTGVTELCCQYGRVIVLEDDFILHPFFLDFMLQSLDRYADEERVAQVAGYLPPIHPDIDTESFFLPLTTSCGWATWQRAWSLFSWDVETAHEKLNSDSSLRNQFDLDGSYPYFDMFRETIMGQADSWAVLWYWSTFYHGKLTLYPYHSLVWVGGFDDLATHTISKKIPVFYDQSLDSILQVDWGNSISFPDAARTDEIAFGKLKNFLRHGHPDSVITRLAETLKRKLIGFVKMSRQQ